MNQQSLVKYSYFFGVLIPLGETLRRGTELGYFPNYIDDYIIGAVLIWAAWATKNSKWYGNAILVSAWAALCGGLYYSFTGQFLVTNEVSGLPNWVILCIKGGLYITAFYFLFQAVKNVAKNH